MVDGVATQRAKSLWRRLWDSPILLLAVTTLIWAGHALVSRLAVGELGPMTLVFLRWTIGLAPFFLSRAKPSSVISGCCAPTGCA